MEDEAAELVERIKTKVTEYNERIANAIYDYYTANEFNGIFMFQSELNDKTECYMLDFIGLQYKLKQYEKDWIYNSIYEIVFGYKPEEEEKNNKKNEELEEDDIMDIIDIDNDGIILPSQLKWSLSHYEISKYNTFLNKHFPRLHQSTHYGDSGGALLHILAVGHKYKIDLLSLMIDIYTEYRINIYIESNKNKFVQFKEFMNKSIYFKNLDYKIREYYMNGITYYVRKFQHILLFNPLNQINDSYFKFVQYTCSLTICLNKLKNIFINKTGCPLQIDFWIIPNHVISVSDVTMPFLGGDDDDDDNLFNYIDDDEEENGNTDFLDELNAPNSDDNDEQIGKIEQRLDSAKIEYIKEIIKHNEYKNNISMKMLNAIKFVCKNKYSFKRIVIIIDRRDSSTKLNKNSDTMYVYQPNKPYGDIINDDNFCHETMNNLSVSYLLPKLRYEQRPNHISCIDDLKGRMFTLSFHIYQWNKIRCYHYLQTGVCTRFKKKYLYQLWPILFFDDINRDGFKKVNKQYVDKEFKIPLNDKIFDVWYPKITGKPLTK